MGYTAKRAKRSKRRLKCEQKRRKMKDFSGF